jgi:uncharacterized protein with LGFP repeats
MLRASEPLTPGEVADRLRLTARDLGPAGHDRETGFGLLDVAGAVAYQSPITAKHLELGGDRGLLGPAAGPEVPVHGGRSRGFSRGSIFWSATTGAHEVHGLVLDTYRGLGATRSALGFPTSDEQPTPDGRGRLNHFQRGSIYFTPATGAREVRGTIRDAWWRLGAERSAVGFPTSNELGTPDGRGRANHFQHGTVYWTPTTGAHEVRGAIRDTWWRLGAERSALGFPISDEQPTPDRRAQYNHFERGSIYFTPATGAREVRGAIRDAWWRLGAERSALGFPASDELGTPDGRGRANHFQHGSVYWTPTTGAHEVRGAIRDGWLRLGAERSWLGYPVSDEYAVPGGRASDFERGRLRWDAATGAVTATAR